MSTTNKSTYDYLRKYEGFRLKAYVDVDGYSVGLGWKITKNGRNDIQTSKYTNAFPDRIKRIWKFGNKKFDLLNESLPSEFYVISLFFDGAIAGGFNDLMSKIKITLTQVQYNALFSLVWNLGFMPNDLKNAINSSPNRDVYKNQDLITKEWKKYNTIQKVPASILIERRKKEIDYFFSEKKTNKFVNPGVGNSQIVGSPINPNKYQTVLYDEGKKVAYEMVGAGIWGITKLLIDEEVANRIINDATIAFDQGSLFNFVKKICQEPFVEFMSDTYQDMFYFIVRKPPFTRESFLSLPTFFIDDKYVFADSFQWETECYSWYQLIPSSYLVSQSQIYQYISAVFFEEYAEIFGSKPMSITTNYIEWAKGTRDELMQDKAYEDLRFLIDCHSYLPFTRKGTITLKGVRNIRRGCKIYYVPTNEYFYIDSVNQSYININGQVDRVTTLQVSRGMVADFVDSEIENEFSLNYFNIINFGDYQEQKIREYKKLKPVNNFTIYFDSKEDSPISRDVLEKESDKILDSELYNFRLSKEAENRFFISEVVKLLYNNKFLTLTITGFTDNKGNPQFNIELSKKRAENIKRILIQKYDLIYSEILPENRITVKFLGENKSVNSQATSIELALNRRAEITVDEIKYEVTSFKSPEEGNWRVNKAVFRFFLERKQKLIDSSFSLQEVEIKYE
jgi:outer membrane protein OmpA-like peptidoglycan-associated protein/GH24 family phage-related lysozyme (muramidase)